MNENETNYCSYCGCEICGDDYFTLGDEILCSNCWDEETVECENCHTRIWLSDDAGDSNLHLCQRCYDNYFTTCEDCGRVIDRDLAHYDDDDYPYCSECFEKRESASIHNYSYKPTPIFYGEGPRFFGVELEIDGEGKDCEKADEILDVGNPFDEQIYIKSDGSLYDGMEIVSRRARVGMCKFVNDIGQSF